MRGIIRGPAVAGLFAGVALFLVAACASASSPTPTPAASVAAARSPTAAPPREPQMKPPDTAPLPDNALALTGRKLFLASCAHCHGADAEGDEGPDLHDLDVSDHRIATVIQRGIKGEMPSFAKKHSDDDITALTAYLRTLHGPETPDPISPQAAK